MIYLSSSTINIVFLSSIILSPGHFRIHPECKARPSFQPVFCPDPASVSLHDLPADCQSQTYAVFLIRTFSAKRNELPEYLLLLPRFNPAPVIFHDKIRLSFLERHTEPYMAAFLRILYRIVKKVHEHLYDQPSVHICREQLLRHRIRKSAVLPQARDMAFRLIDQIFYNFLLFFYKVSTVLYFCHTQNVFHRPRKPQALLPDIFYQRLILRAVSFTVLQDQVTVTDDPCQRCSEVMGDAAEHTALKVLSFHLKPGLLLFRID